MSTDGSQDTSADRAIVDDLGRDPEVERFPFRFAPSYRWAARVFGVTPSSAGVTVTGSGLEATFGPWKVSTPLSNIADAELTGPYHLAKTAGPARLSFADAGLTFATNGERGVHVTFYEAVTGADPFGRIHSPDLTVTVADCALLVASLLSRLT